MDRVRALSPALSGAAHVVAAGVLTCAPLFLADRLPAPPSLQSLSGARGPVVLLAGGMPRVEPGRTRVRPTLTPARPVLPLAFALDRVPLPDASLDLGTVGPAGIGEGPGEGAGLCLFDCDAGPGLHEGTARDPSERERAPLRVRVGGDVREPVKQRDAAPVYPQLALAARVQGAVVLQCVIDTEGKVSDVEVVSGHPLLTAAAVAAVSGWRYRPTLLNGEPVSVILTVTVTFSLR